MIAVPISFKRDWQTVLATVPSYANTKNGEPLSSSFLKRLFVVCKTVFLVETIYGTIYLVELLLTSVEWM